MANNVLVRASNLQIGDGIYHPNGDFVTVDEIVRTMQKMTIRFTNGEADYVAHDYKYVVEVGD